MDRDVSIELTRLAAEWLGDKGYDDRMGARPLAADHPGTYQNAHWPRNCLFGKLVKGGLVRVTVRDGRIENWIFVVHKNARSQAKSRHC